MPEHYCDLCNYSSCDLSNYQKHLNTRKHQKNVHSESNTKKQLLPDRSRCLPSTVPIQPDLKTGESKTTIKCDNCNTEFSRNCNLVQHKKVCKAKKTDDITVNKLKTQIKEIEEAHKMEIEKLILNYELKLANQSSEFANERADLIQNHVLSRIDDLKDQHFFDRSLINTAGKLVSSQQNTLTYLTNNFKETPPLIEFNDVEALKEYKDKDIIYGEDKELWYVLATQYKDGLDMTNNTKTKYSHKGAKNVVSYLSRFLAHAYKNTEFPEKQQIWSSDTARLVFLFRKKVVESKKNPDRSTIAWVSDKEASELKNIVFVPFKDILLELLVSRRQELNQQLVEEQEDGMNDDEFDRRYEELEYLDDIVEFIKTEMFLRDLIIETCPKFKFQFNIHDQNFKEERKTLKFTPTDKL